MPPDRSRRVLPLALLISVMLHALLGAWWMMAAREASPGKPSSVAAIPIEIVFNDPPEVVSEPQPPPILATPEPPRPKAKRPPQPIPEPQPPTLATPEPPPAVPSPSDAPLSGLSQEALSQNGAGPRVMLRPDALNPTLFNGTVPLEAPPDAGVVRREPTPADENFVANLVRDDLSRARVSRGVAHSYYGELGKALLKTWDAERAVEARGLEGWLEQSKKRVADFSRLYVDRAKRFAQTGNPLENANTDKRKAPTSSTGADLAFASLDVRRQMKTEIREDLRESRRAEVKVIQDGRGKLLSVELIKPSSDEQVDRAALEDIRAAAENMPVPPPEMVGADDRIESVWQFELIVSISPPAPVVTFTFDEVLGNFDARLPLDRRIYKRIELVAVY